jgi:hypothetical protein
MPAMECPMCDGTGMLVAKGDRGGSGGTLS